MRIDPEAAFDAQHADEYSAPYGPRLLSRRGLLRGLAAGAVFAPGAASASISALMCPPQVGTFGGGNVGGASGEGLLTEDFDYSGEVPDDGPGLRRLKMTNSRTGDTFDRPYVEGGQYVQEALEEFSYFARDWRRNEVKPFDPKTIDIIWKTWRKLDTDRPFNLNSGYRSPATNKSLSGAARQSLHLSAKAADLTHSSRSVAQIHAAAVSVKGGGVGKYTSSGFVHVDSGRVRFWGS